MQHGSARQSGMRKCPDDFLCCKRSFLLIARTDRIVTAVLNGRRVPSDARVFQHIARFVHGTTVVTIVTAAVYRGFILELRSPKKANPST